MVSKELKMMDKTTGKIITIDKLIKSLKSNPNQSILLPVELIGFIEQEVGYCPNIAWKS